MVDEEEDNKRVKRPNLKRALESDSEDDVPMKRVRRLRKTTVSDEDEDEMDVDDDKPKKKNPQPKGGLHSFFKPTNSQGSSAQMSQPMPVVGKKKSKHPMAGKRGYHRVIKQREKIADNGYFEFEDYSSYEEKK
mmetsp:Transcript_17498/g.26969  ORF Transcript_17498/g.26969 Transcript_17498/m.26969 type:complete len:134 (-) Transcript_17498:1407-1808(-)